MNLIDKDGYAPIAWTVKKMHGGLVVGQSHVYYASKRGDRTLCGRRKGSLTGWQETCCLVEEITCQICKRRAEEMLLSSQNQEIKSC